MVFSSVVFLFIFLPLVLAVYFPLRNQRRLRNAVLLVASIMFYFWGEGIYILIFLTYFIVNHYAGRVIEKLKAREWRHGGKRWSRAVLVSAIIFDLSVLIFFKYTNFLVAGAAPFLKTIGIDVSIDPIHLPIGISFFTFQAMSYVIDIYRSDAKAANSLIDFSTYLAFFPQLIAGPIVRYVDVSKQIVKRQMSREGFCEGTKRFIIGLGKKVVIANTAAVAVDQIFKLPTNEIALPVAWLGVLCYALQIYFDFSGYSDMAIGMGKMFGIDFLENFNYPYIAQSIKDFWRRWHISLSTWFRDYLYIPLGGNRCSPWRVHANLLLVFFLCGLWHGANWTFAVWGLWHGCFLVLERSPFGALLQRAWSPIRSIYTLAVVAIGWVFFRSESMTYALNYLAVMFGLTGAGEYARPLNAYLTNDLAIAVVIGILFSMPLAPAIEKYVSRRLLSGGDSKIQSSWSAYAMEATASGAYLVVFVICSMLLVSGTHNPFIYFRF